MNIMIWQDTILMSAHTLQFENVIFWPRFFYSEIFNYCKTCEICQKEKNHTHPPKSSLGVWPEAEVWERIHIDLLGPLPKTKEGNQYILLVVDAFSKWPETFKLKGSSEIEV